MKLVKPFIVDDFSLLSCDVPSDDFSEYSALVTYDVGTRIVYIGAFSTNIHRIYESLQNNNLNHSPLTNPDWWTLVSYPPNPWRMFDYSVSSQTTKLNSINFAVIINKRINTVAFLNVDAYSISLTATNESNNVIFQKTVSLIDNSGINGWYDYFFQPREKVRDVVITGLPLDLGLTYTVSILNQGATAACGAAIFGQSRDLGCTLYGASVGIDDYSVKKKDEFGNTTLKERSYSKNGSFTIGVEKQHASKLPALLAKYRATPILYLGTEEYEGTFILGFYTTFKELFAGYNDITCSIEIEGLT